VPLDPEAARRFQFAKEDLKADRVMVCEGFPHFACFHAQQAAEKALKSYLVTFGKTVPREHHLASLVHHSIRAKFRGRGLDRACKILDQYWTFAK